MSADPTPGAPAAPSTPAAGRVLALTQGDPAGIGPDLALDLWSRRACLDLPRFLYLGDPLVLERRAQVLGLTVPLAAADATTAGDIFASALPVFAIPAGLDVVAGQPHPASARGTMAAIETAVALSLSGAVRAMVTNPISKSVLYQAGFGFPGHTEFLADLAARATGRPYLPVMMLAGPLLRTVPVTIHIPLKDVATTLTEDLIVDTCRIVDMDLRRHFGIARPRLAVAGLNPHAGEQGGLGSEDERVIAPALTRLRDEGIHAVGPLPADTLFHSQARQHYDVAICMYHDQALIPVKALDFDRSVNVTLGLPFLRTSPDHGTAFGLAGQGIARADSLLSALQLADSIGSAQGAGAPIPDDAPNALPDDRDKGQDRSHAATARGVPV